MANLLQIHNLTVTSASGSRIIPLILEQGWTGHNAYASGGTLSPTVSISGGNLVLEWDANTSTAGKGTVIVVEVEDGQGDVLSDCLAFNQSGSQFNVTVYGSDSLDGEAGSGTYSVSSTVNGGFGLSSLSPWLSVDTVSKTSSNAGTAVVSWSRNEGESRPGVLKMVLNYQFNPYTTTWFMVLTQGTYVPGEPRIVYEPNSASLTYKAGSFTSNTPLVSGVSGIGIKSRTGNMDITGVSIDSPSGRLIVNYGENLSSDELSETITVSGTSASGEVTAVFYLYQASYSYVVNPIWKTTAVEVTGKDFVNYSLTTEGRVIYSGRAYQMPGDGSISFELNEIVRDYVDNTLWWREGYQTPSGWDRTFTLEMEDGSVSDYVFTKDWSYVERDYSSSPFICLNEPIIDTIPEGCFVPVCVFSPQRAGDASFTTTDTLGHTTTAYTANLDTPRQARFLSTAVNGYRYGLSAEGLARDSVYTGTDRCFTPFVLYYENSYGGIDAMPIRGNVTATDKITAYTTRNSVRVPSLDFSYRRYLNDISKTWELRTGFLSDLQASRMHHLIESTLVYLYDVAADSVCPVVVDETSLTYKTYRNQGRKFFNYSFKVRESQNKIRK